jgi:hypothetical protein
MVVLATTWPALTRGAESAAATPNTLVALPAPAVPGTPIGRPLAVSARTNMVTPGAGVRFYWCDRINFGVGSALAVPGNHFAEEQMRIEFR